MTQTRKRPGRPPENKGGKNIQVYLTPEDIERARTLGNGNVSAGIRKALLRTIKNTNDLYVGERCGQ